MVSVVPVALVSVQVEPFDEVCQLTVPVYPVKVIEADEPAQTVFTAALAVPPTLGNGFTVTVALPVLIQPFASVPVTV